MSENDIHGIQTGWSIKTADGQDVGSVEETTERYILVKSGRINTSHHYLPAATLAHVRPELKEIAVSLTEAQINEGDWSEAPTEGPRTESAPLNVESDAEADVVMGGSVAVPEKPTTL